MDRKRRQTACFTGHRMIMEPEGAVRARVMKAVECLIKEGYLYFGAGGARGFDALASESVLEMKKQYPKIHLIMVLPFDSQYVHEGDWGQADIGQYCRLKEQASKVVILSSGYSPGIYHKRNRHLVDCSSVCVAYMTKGNSGTGYTVNYAKAKGLRVVNIADASIDFCAHLGSKSKKKR